MGQMARRDALAEQLSHHVGAFDHREKRWKKLRSMALKNSAFPVLTAWKKLCCRAISTRVPLIMAVTMTRPITRLLMPLITMKSLTIWAVNNGLSFYCK